MSNKKEREKGRSNGVRERRGGKKSSSLGWRCVEGLSRKPRGVKNKNMDKSRIIRMEEERVKR